VCPKRSEQRVEAKLGIESEEVISENRWYALCTRSRHEKKVAAVLSDRGFDEYLPLISRESQWHDRRKRILWPLFPGYVLARFSPEEAGAVVGVPGVVSVVSVAGSPAPIPESDISNIRALVAAADATGSLPESEVLLEEGQRVEIIRGPFQGVRGIVIERRGARITMQVGLSAIRRGVRLEVPASAARVLEE
jgi:transcription antitermination factor NusG